MPHTAITTIYTALPANSIVRKFVAEAACIFPDPKWLDEHRDDLPKDFYVDLACGWPKDIKAQDSKVFDEGSGFVGATRIYVHNGIIPKCL